MRDWQGNPQRKVEKSGAVIELFYPVKWWKGISQGRGYVTTTSVPDANRNINQLNEA